MKTTISTDMKLSSKMRNRIQHEVRKNIGKNVCTLHKVPYFNEYDVYTELEHQKLDKSKIELFQEVFETGTYYLLGMVEIKKTQQKIFFLADIKQPMYITEKNKIFYPREDETIIIHVK